jgi:rSAM/selenodomain-associated transferase 1
MVAPDVVVAYAPADGRGELEALLPGDLLWTEQPAGSLTERLEAAAAYATGAGLGPLLLIGTDSPTLPASFLRTALAILHSDHTEVVLGPTEDGGFYLVGFHRSPPHLFDEIAWSTSHVFEQTVANAERLGLRVRSLPGWYDVDTPEDLLRLRGELDTDAEARSRARATHRWLCAHASLAPLSRGR